MNQNELYHYGVKGMKWKDHKYQRIENGQYIYRTPAEQKLYDSRIDYNSAKREVYESQRNLNSAKKAEKDAESKYVSTPFWAFNNKKKYKVAIQKRKEAEEDVNVKKSVASSKKEAYDKAWEKYKKSPMRKMKIAVRVGKSRATNVIRNLKDDHYINPRLQNKKPYKKKKSIDEQQREKSKSLQERREQSKRRYIPNKSVSESSNNQQKTKSLEERRKQAMRKRRYIK